MLTYHLSSTELIVVRPIHQRLLSLMVSLSPPPARTWASTGSGTRSWWARPSAPRSSALSPEPKAMPRCPEFGGAKRSVFGGGLRRASLRYGLSASSADRSAVEVGGPSIFSVYRVRGFPWTQRPNPLHDRLQEPGRGGLRAVPRI